VEQDIELIEKYLADQLSPAERTQVEERLQQDAQFASRMELIAQTRQAVDSEVDLFREDLDKAFEEYQATQKPSISFYRSPRLIAASILLLLGVGLGYFLLQSSNDPQELYTAYFQVPQENLTVRDDSSNGQLNMALEAYNQGNYQQALERFKRQKQPILNDAQIESLLVRNTCVACHQKEKRLVGPAYRDIAMRKYSDERIVQLIYNPQPKNWPEYTTPMAAMPQLPKDEALKIAAWINSLAK